MTRPSQQRAKNKYDAVHYTVVGCKIRKEDAEAFKEACKMRETSPNAIFREAMNRFMSGDPICADVLEEYREVIKDHAKAADMSVDDFVKMTREEMIEYYGVDYIPDVPADIKPWEDERSGIYKRDGGTGEVYWDTDILNYSNEDFTRSVHVEVDKGSYVLQDYLYFKGTEEKSVINNVDVLIGLTENGYYYSEFMYKGVGFLIDAKGVTLDEFVAIISSIIK